jgi:hypothetical protein
MPLCPAENYLIRNNEEIDWSFPERLVILVKLSGNQKSKSFLSDPSDIKRQCRIVIRPREKTISGSGLSGTLSGTLALVRWFATAVAAFGLGEVDFIGNDFRRAVPLPFRVVPAPCLDGADDSHPRTFAEILAAELCLLPPGNHRYKIRLALTARILEAAIYGQRE